MAGVFDHISRVHTQRGGRHRRQLSRNKIYFPKGVAHAGKGRPVGLPALLLPSPKLEKNFVDLSLSPQVVMNLSRKPGGHASDAHKT